MPANPVCITGAGFFVEPGKHGGISAFEAYHLRSSRCMRDKKRVDLFLWGRSGKPTLADMNHHRFAAGKLEDGWADQTVMDYHIRFVQRFAGLKRQQFRIARTGADKGDMTGTGLFCCVFRQ